MTDAAKVNDDVLRAVLRRLLPNMDAQTVTLSALLNVIQQDMHITREELKPWKSCVKRLVADMLNLCRNADTPVKNMSSRKEEVCLLTPSAVSGNESDKAASTRGPPRETTNSSLMRSSSDDEASTRPTRTKSKDMTKRGKCIMERESSSDEAGPVAAKRFKKHSVIHDDSSEDEEEEAVDPVYVTRNEMKDNATGMVDDDNDDDNDEDEDSNEAHPPQKKRNKRKDTQTLARQKHKQKTTVKTIKRPKHTKTGQQDMPPPPPPLSSRGLEQLKQMACVAGLLGYVRPCLSA
jgi:hypothetical protein